MSKFPYILDDSPKAQVALYVGVGVLGLIGALALLKYFFKRRNEAVLEELKALPNVIVSMIVEYVPTDPRKRIEKFLPVIDKMLPPEGKAFDASPRMSIFPEKYDMGAAMGQLVDLLNGALHAFAEGRLREFIYSLAGEDICFPEFRTESHLFMGEKEELEYLRGLFFEKEFYSGTGNMKNFILQTCEEENHSQFKQEYEDFFNKLELILCNDLVEENKKEQKIAASR